MTVMNNDKHEAFYTQEINDDTIILALDFSGGMCDRLMLGRKGILCNANASIECFNDGYEDEEDYFKPFDINSTSEEDLLRAIQILETDNFHIMLVLNQTIVCEDLIVGRDLITASGMPAPNTPIVVDVTKVEFDENNIYSIY